MPLSGYVALLRRWWWTLLVAVWAAALISFLLASGIAPTYSTQTRLLVGPVSGDLDTLRASGQLAQTYAEYVTSTPVLDGTIDDLGLEMTTEELAAVVKAGADDVTRFLTIQVEDADPAQAAAIADSLAQGLIAATAQGPTRPEGEVRVTEPASTPTSPIAPDVAIIVLVAALAGLVGAVLLVIVIETLADAVRTPFDLGRASRAPVLGVVPSLEGGELIPPKRGTTVGDAYRTLGATIALRMADRGDHSIAVISADPGRRGGAEALSLAAAMGVIVPQVVLLDADADLPALGKLPSIDHVTIERGAPGGHGTGSLATARDRIDGLATGDGGLLVVHSGPVSDPSSLIWARSASAVVIFAVKDRTRRSRVTAAVEDLARIDAEILGAVLLEDHRRRSTQRMRAWVGHRATPPGGSTASDGATGQPAAGPVGWPSDPDPLVGRHAPKTKSRAASDPDGSGEPADPAASAAPDRHETSDAPGG